MKRITGYYMKSEDTWPVKQDDGSTTQSVKVFTRTVVEDDVCVDCFCKRKDIQFEDVEPVDPPKGEETYTVTNKQLVAITSWVRKNYNSGKALSFYVDYIQPIKQNK